MSGEENFPCTSAEVTNETILSKDPEGGGLILSMPPYSTTISVQFSYFKSLFATSCL
jgi:hypothetical protein